VSDQSFGGVSDITNRGDIDKLLLSELAYDDTTLMVRLANNEAMYLRREELPSNLHKDRIILMDSTIKMWGIPRVFATSVGLACSIQDKNVASINSFLLSGEKSHKVDLATKEGVIKGLGELHPELHCADALHLFVEENKIGEETELILITDEVSLQNEDFKKTLNEVRGALTYLITINRTGHLHFYEYSLSGRRLISKTLYDLEELLFKTERKVKTTKSKIDNSVAKELPEIYRHRPFPMFFPTPSIRFTKDNTFDLGTGGVAAITNDYRILYWKDRSVGAKELLTYTSSQKYEVTYFDGWVYILEMKSRYVYDKNSSKILDKWYAINLSDESQSLEVDFSGKEMMVQNVRVEMGRFYLMDNQGKIFFIENSTGDLEPYFERKRFGKKDNINFTQVKKLVNNGYTTLRKAKKIVVLYGKDGFESGLKLNDWELKFTNYGLYFEQNKNNWGGNYSFKDEFNLKRGHTKFRKVTFHNGSVAMTDSSGFLHLISADKSIPQVTIPMIVGGAFTAAWASDGAVTGSSYFIGVSNVKKISSEEFYKKYILPILDSETGRSINARLKSMVD